MFINVNFRSSTNLKQRMQNLSDRLKTRPGLVKTVRILQNLEEFKIYIHRVSMFMLMSTSFF